MDGVFLINKPKNLTSRDVVNALIKKFNNKKMGHVGTLDPFATGLLLVVCGKATKIVPFLEDNNKHYIATLKLGEATDTLDNTGKVIKTKEVPSLTKRKVEKVLKLFLGDLPQIPPMYSAVKVNGVPLYKLARQNIEIPRKERVVKILNIHLIKFKKNLIRFSIDCSKGTYIRVLGEQIAERLNTVGHLEELTRTKIGTFNLKSAKSYKNITKDDLMSITHALNFYDIVVADEKTTIDIKNGKTIILENHQDRVLFVDNQNTALAIYEKTINSVYKSIRGLF